MRELDSLNLSHLHLLQGYITCAWGVSKIGYVLICYGLSDAVFSAAFGHIMHFIGKTVICSIAVCSVISCLSRN